MLTTAIADHCTIRYSLQKYIDIRYTAALYRYESRENYVTMRKNYRQNSPKSLSTIDLNSFTDFIF